MANLAISDGWKFITPRGSQRRAPYTTLPTPGTNTAISSTSETMNSQGAQRSQVRIGTWNAISAATKATHRNTACRIRKKLWSYLAKRGLSGMAIDAEYTITSPQASSATVTHSRGWSKPCTRCGWLGVRAKPLAPSFTGKASAAALGRPLNQSRNRAGRRTDMELMLRPSGPWLARHRPGLRRLQ